MGYQLSDSGDRLGQHDETIQNVLPFVNARCFAERGRLRGMDTSKEAVAMRLEKARIKAGYESAAAAARAFGWVEGTYRSNENGQRMPSRKALRKYAKAFNEDFDFLETGVRTNLKRLDERQILLHEAYERMSPEQQNAIIMMALATVGDGIRDDVLKIGIKR
jgi:transcriptional regulator with XRE-family HTH domain